MEAEYGGKFPWTLLSSYIIFGVAKLLIWGRKIVSFQVCKRYVFNLWFQGFAFLNFWAQDLKANKTWDSRRGIIVKEKTISYIRRQYMSEMIFIT